MKYKHLLYLIDKLNFMYILINKFTLSTIARCIQSTWHHVLYSPHAPSTSAEQGAKIVR